jgi:hypothetical protein
VIRITPFKPDPIIDGLSRAAVIHGGVLAGRIEKCDWSRLIMHEYNHRVMQNVPPGKNTPITIWACGIEFK